MPGLSTRRKRILGIIVDDYVSTGVPVPSSAVAQGRRVKVSPATVRNEMAALEQYGYILRPHISAGSVPSDKGYRFFVEALPRELAPTVRDAAAVQWELTNAPPDPDAWSEASASAVAALLNSLAFATGPRGQTARAKQVELIYLQELAVMLVVVLQEASVRKQLVPLNLPVTPESVDAAAERIRALITGKTASEIEGARPSGADEIEGGAIDSTIALLHERDSEEFGDRVVQGLQRLLHQPELVDAPDRVRDVLDALEDSRTMVSIAAAAPEGGEAAVVIGRENRLLTLRDLSVVVCRYGVPGEAQGLLGMIGPTRMSYRRALPVVKYAASLLSGLTARVYGTPAPNPAPASN